MMRVIKIFLALLLTSNLAFSEEYTLKNWGLKNIEVPALSQVTTNRVTVAVIDTGIDTNHPDLSKKTVSGWDFVKKGQYSGDDHGHGTHVAGIIGAVAKNVSLMPIRYYSDSNSGYENLINTVAALNYAVSHGARIINYSGGGPEFSESEYLALKEAESKKVLVVTAAGNEHRNAALNPYYPCAYNLKNMICVAATDIQDQLLASSNWSPVVVDVAAPGENIYSLLPSGRYGYMTGTSQATAFVSGLAALLLSKRPDLTPEKVKSIIAKSVDINSTLIGRVLSGGRINAKRAIELLKSTGVSKNTRFTHDN